MPRKRPQVTFPCLGRWRIISVIAIYNRLPDTLRLRLIDFVAYAETERIIATFAAQPNGGLIPVPSALMGNQRDFIISLAHRYRLPNVFAFRYYPAKGGLASYGVDPINLYKRAASYIDRILKGEKPADLPVQMANKYELVINLKTAKALGLDIPISVLARTDEVIE
jgi:ABC-type uncharacterized transport system substrate-binding protein